MVQPEAMIACIRCLPSASRLVFDIIVIGSSGLSTHCPARILAANFSTLFDLRARAAESRYFDGQDYGVGASLRGSPV